MLTALRITSGNHTRSRRLPCWQGFLHTELAAFSVETAGEDLAVVGDGNQHVPKGRNRHVANGGNHQAAACGKQTGCGIYYHAGDFAALAIKAE